MDFEPEQHDFVITKVKKLHREAFSVYGDCGSKPDSEPTWYASGTRTEGVSESKEPSDENIQAAAELAKEAATPITDMRGTIEFRKHLCEVLTRRALHTAVERAREEN